MSMFETSEKLESDGPTGARTAEGVRIRHQATTNYVRREAIYKT